MITSRRAYRVLAAVALATTATATGVVLIENADAATNCPGVDVVFARGTGELPGLGIVGRPLADGITSKLSGTSVTSYGVNYAADYMQASAGSGATDMTKHVTQLAAQCPDTVFVLGGYSQGATVTDIALGAGSGLGQGQQIPANLAPKIKAVTVFGNPLRLMGQPLSTAQTPVKGRVLDQCNTGDPVCAGGADITAHLMYPLNGSVDKAVDFAVANIKNTGTSTTTGSTTTGSTATSTPTGTTATSTTGSTTGSLLPGIGSMFGGTGIGGSTGSMFPGIGSMFGGTGTGIGGSTGSMFPRIGSMFGGTGTGTGIGGSSTGSNLSWLSSLIGTGTGGSSGGLTIPKLSSMFGGAGTGMAGLGTTATSTTSATGGTSSGS